MSRFALFAMFLLGCPATVAPPSGNARVRVAHLSSDAPAVDFCLAPHGTETFTGPILATNGHATGLTYGNVTKYFDVEAIQYDVRIVAPGSADCATSLGGLPDFTDLPELPTDASATIAAEGLVAFGSTTPFMLKPYIDDAAVDTGKAKLRFVHASPGTPAVDVGLGGGALFTSVFSDVSYGGTAANAYVTVDGFTGAEISARPHGTLTDAIAIKPASLPAGAIATAFAIGRLGNATTPLRVLLCVDNDAPNGLLSSCNVVGGAPERAHVRVAHLSPDTPAVDVCIAATGGAFAKPLLKSIGALDGLSYANVTSYVDLPVGFYDLRIIHATASDCSTGAVPDTKNLGIHTGITGTIAAIGDLDRAGAAAGDPALQLALFVDIDAVSSARAKLRFVHASPGTPAVDVGLGKGASWVKVFGNVSFGHVATNGGIDGFGYVDVAGPMTSAVAARVAGSSTDALVIQSVTLAPNTISTAFAIGNKTGTATNPLAVLLCTDNASSSSLLATCVVAP